MMDDPRIIGPIVKLSSEEMQEVMSDTPTIQQGLFISGFVDYVSQEVVLFKADPKSAPIIASFKLFPASGTTEPDFQKFELIDCGHTIKLGEYEASSAAILYELDSEYKKYADANRKTE
jgi:hypothetical protein